MRHDPSWQGRKAEYLPDPGDTAPNKKGNMDVYFFCSTSASSITATVTGGTQKTETKTVDGKTVTTITTTYTYDDQFFALEVQADAVQTHNAEDAIKSAWGRDVTISGTTLSLK